MNHKEKCKALKEVRKTIADKLGIDLHQTECTYEGECSGTCPKCAKEERTLNKALLSGAVIASSIALCACNVTTGADNVDRVDRDKDKESKKGESKGNSGKTKNTKNAIASLFGLGEEDDVPYPDYYSGGLEYGGGEVEELAGDVAIAAWTYDELCELAANYSGAPICEVDSVDENGNVLIHCYEIVDNGEDDVHTATVDWLTVDPYSTETTNLMGETFYLNEY